jgi:hypothetical protein
LPFSSDKLTKGTGRKEGGVREKRNEGRRKSEERKRDLCCLALLKNPENTRNIDPENTVQLCIVSLSKLEYDHAVLHVHVSARYAIQFTRDNESSKWRNVVVLPRSRVPRDP